MPRIGTQRDRGVLKLDADRFIFIWYLLAGTAIERGALVNSNEREYENNENDENGSIPNQCGVTVKSLQTMNEEIGAYTRRPTIS